MSLLHKESEEENTNDGIFMREIPITCSKATFGGGNSDEIGGSTSSPKNLPNHSIIMKEEKSEKANNNLEQQRTRVSSPEIPGKKVTFKNSRVSSVIGEEKPKGTTDINGESLKSNEKSEPIKIPEKVKKSKSNRKSKNSNHLSFVESDSSERKSKKKESSGSLVSPMSSHAFGFFMNAPSLIINQHNACTITTDDGHDTIISETVSTIESPSEESKNDFDSIEKNAPKLPIPIGVSSSSPESMRTTDMSENETQSGRNIRDILKGLASFEEEGKRFMVVGLGYECHRFDCAKKMLDHISGEDQDAESFWIDCQQSTVEDIHALQKYFGIHSLTAEDVINNDSGEKWEVFDNYMFMIFTGQIADKISSNEYLPCHLNVLIFENCIITIHDKPIEGTDLLMNRIEKEFEIDSKHCTQIQQGKSIKEKRDIIEKIRAGSTPRKTEIVDMARKRKSTTIPSPSWVFYAYLDAIIDVYIPKVDNLTRECDTLDEFTVSLNTTEKEDLLWRIAINKRRTIILRKLLLPKQKMITYLVSSRVPLPFIDKEIQLYLRDVCDHLTYCCDRLDIARDSLHQSHTNYLTRVQIEIAQNAQKTDAFMNRLTVFASIFGPLSVLSGIWGMNVKVPGQDVDNLYWFFGICAFMVILSLTLVMILRKQLVSM